MPSGADQRQPVGAAPPSPSAHPFGTWDAGREDGGQAGKNSPAPVTAIPRTQRAFPRCPGREEPGCGPRASPPRRLCDVSPRRSAARPPARPLTLLVGTERSRLKMAAMSCLLGSHMAPGTPAVPPGEPRGRRAGATGAARAAAPGTLRPPLPGRPRARRRGAVRPRPVAAETGAERGGPGVRGGLAGVGTRAHRLRPARSHGDIGPGRDRGEERAQPLNARTASARHGSERHVHLSDSSRHCAASLGGSGI